MLKVVHPVRRLLAVLMSLVVLTSAFGRASVAWACEGKVCSSNAATCCCASPKDVRDELCLAPSKGNDGMCKGRCVCTAVVLKAATVSTFHAPKAVRTVVLVDAAVAFLPQLVLPAQGFVLLEAPQLRSIPPPHCLPDPPCVQHPSLRAPPAMA